MIIPKYLENFACIGGICEDNCCIGWDVDIDKKTYTKYQKVDHSLMKRELKRFIKINPNVYNEDINYAFAMLTEEKHCSFLNADRLCMIQKHLGESYLSNVCCEFPRITNRIDGLIERSATPSCPEITRLLLNNPDAMTLVEIADPLSTPILTYDIFQKDKRFNNLLISRLLDVRNTCLKIIENPLSDFESQLVALSDFILNSVALEKKSSLNRLNDVIDKSLKNEPYDSKTKNENPAHFLDLSTMLLTHLKEVGSVDSERFTALSEKAALGNAKLGLEIFERFNREFPHVLRNLFLNHIYKNLFPFSEGSNPEEALWLLLCRYVIIKRQLMCLAGHYGHLDTFEVTQYLQVFSKVIEHHKHFEEHTLAKLKSQKYSTKRLLNAL